VHITHYIPAGLSLLAGLGLSVAFAAVILPLVRRVVGKLEQYISDIRAQKAYMAAPKAIRKRFSSRTKTRNRNLPGWFVGWEEQLEHKLTDAGLAMHAVRYILFIIAGGFIGFLLGVVVLKNVPAALIIAASAFLLPEQYLASKITKKREKIINQLAPAVRIFYAEYNDTPQAERALLITGERVRAPLGPILYQTGRRLASNHNPDEAFAELAKKLDFYHGRMFAQLLRQAYDDSAVAPLFSRLATKIASYQQLSKKNRSSLASEGVVARLLNVMVLPVFLFMQYIVPETTSFLVGHPVGRIIVTLCFASILVGIILDRMLSEVKL